MTKETGKKVLAVIGAAAIIGTVLAGCSAASGEKEKDNASITVISREEGSGTRDAFVELMGIVDENDNDITIQTAEITNSTSVMTSTVAGNKSAIRWREARGGAEERSRRWVIRHKKTQRRN